MTRTFVKTSSDSPLKLTTLCLTIALGLLVHGAPSVADDAQMASATTHAPLLMASIC